MKDGLVLNFQCHMGVWGFACDPVTDWVRDRTDECFFFPHLDGRGLKSTVELETCAASRREAEKDRLWTRRAFYVTFAALVVSILATITDIILKK